MSIAVLLALTAGLWGTSMTPRSASAATFSVNDLVVVATDRLNLREAPGLDAEVVTVLVQGVQYPVSDGPVAADGYDWYELYNPEGQGGAIGWVAGEFLALADESGEFTAGDRVRVVDGRLNLRDGPGLNGAVIRVLPDGFDMTVTGGPRNAYGHNWYEVAFHAGSQGEGWVAGEFLALEDSGAEFENGDFVRVTGGRLNLRSGPGLANDVIEVLPDNVRLTVSDGPVSADGYTWYAVYPDGPGFGWVAGEFLLLA